MKKMLILAGVIFLVLLFIDFYHAETTEWADARPPLYLYHMELCQKAGGELQQQFSDKGEFAYVTFWQCACPQGLNSFGNKKENINLECNKWLKPEMSSGVSEWNSLFLRMTVVPYLEIKNYLKNVF